MSQQLVVSIDNADSFRWHWLGAEESESATGDLDALSAATGSIAQQAWLLLPGSRVVTRSLDYSEKEKKHLRNLLPFQLEETVIGDIEELHVALGDAKDGKVTLAYTDKLWLRSLFNKLAGAGIEVTRCWSAPLVLPLPAKLAEPIEPVISEEPAEAPAVVVAVTPTWVVALNDATVNVRFAEQQGFGVPLALSGAALDLLVKELHLTENLPLINLRATSQTGLDALFASLPASLRERVIGQEIAEAWQLDYTGKAIDLCQAEFSQRLPLERWWKTWRNLAILALVTFVVYLGVVMFQIHKLNKQNLLLRQQMEATYRQVVPHGQSDDPEKRLRIKLAELQPKTQSSSVVSLLAGVLPVFAASPDITIKAISFAAETGDLSINAQSHSFSSLDSLRQTLIGQGYTVDPLVVNTQGDVNSGRFKINKAQH